MAVTLKQLSEQAERLVPGHGLCPGCSESIVVRQVLMAIEGPVVVATATGCLEVSTTRFPYTAWRVPWVHSAFENAASTMSGIEATYKALVRRDRWTGPRPTFVVFGGDGASYDIGLQWLSGALERGHRFLYICLNNEGYMNTGIQRSSATIKGTWTTTTPVGRAQSGKMERRKDLTRVVTAHNIPYVAQASPHLWKDLIGKVLKAVAKEGPSFINVLAPCTRGWRYEPEETMRLGQLAVETLVWPLYEVDEGVWRLTHHPRKRRPVREWLESQGRFRHLLEPGNEKSVEEIQSWVDEEWHHLLKECGTP
ncbi:MAG: thiamine pyrophosphate-dependent enzyme [Dehalococcoidia bacterium]